MKAWGSIQVLGIACWHVGVLEHNPRWVDHAQIPQEWAHIVALERPARVTSRMMGIFWGEERAGQGGMPERAVLVLLMKAAAARRKRGQLPTQSWCGEPPPPGQEGWRSEDPPGDAVLLTPVTMEPQTLGPRDTQPPAEKPPQPHQIWPEIF